MSLDTQNGLILITRVSYLLRHLPRQKFDFFLRRIQGGVALKEGKMKTYTCNTQLSLGITLTADEKLGQVVFLGENGQGRRYEKVAIDKFTPAEIENGIVFDAETKKIVLPARDGKPEKVFYTLVKPKSSSEAVLVRVNTEGCYTKNTQGRLIPIAGNPETLVSGSGAYGAAGRVGGWSDSLVVMKPGDVIKIHLSGGYKFEPLVLWYGEEGLKSMSWKEYETIQALMHAESAPENSLKFLSGKMPAYTWSHGQVKPGIELEKGSTGKVVSLGEEGHGRDLTEIPLMGKELEGLLVEAAVVVLDEKVVKAQYNWHEDKTVCKYGLTDSPNIEEAGFLVKVSTSWVYTRGSSPEVSVWKGSPNIFAEGRGAQGAAGGIYRWPEVMVVLHEGDVLYVSPEGGYKTSSYALYVKNGQLKTEEWSDWKRRDMKSDPAFYIAKGIAPWGMVPAEWIGKVVTIVRMRGTSRDGYHLDEDPTGEVVQTNPLVLNLGWNGREYHPEPINHPDIFWVKLETEMQVKRLEGEQLEKRVDLRAQADALKNRAVEVADRGHFRLAVKEIKDVVQEIGCASSLDTMSTAEVTTWISFGENTLKRFEVMEEELIELAARQTRGEILVDFGGHFRRMGAANQQDHWVVMPDGTLRDADRIDYRPRYTSEGNKGWRMVTEAELALSWYGDLACRVDKLPVGGCTSEQLATVKKIEMGDLGIPENSFGLDSEIANKFAQKLEEVSKACKRFTPLMAVPVFDWLELSSADGVMIDEQLLKVQPRNMVELKGYKPVEIFRRYGHLIAQIHNVAGGTLQFVVFDKYGRQNLAVRWVTKEVQEIFEGLKSSYFLSRIPVIDIEKISAGMQFDSFSYVYEEELIISATQDQDSVIVCGMKAWSIENLELEEGRVVLYTIDYDGYEHYRLLVRFEEK